MKINKIVWICYFRGSLMIAREDNEPSRKVLTLGYQHSFNISYVQKLCFINTNRQNGFPLDPFLFLHCGKNMHTDKIFSWEKIPK